MDRRGYDARLNAPMSGIATHGATLLFTFESIVRFVEPGRRRPGMRAGACPGLLQIETPFPIPDTTQASFRDDEALPQDCAATDSDLAHSVRAID